MTSRNSSYDLYAEQYGRLPSTGPDWLSALRRRGMDSFSMLGFPTSRKDNEKWKYTNLGALANATFGYAVRPGAVAAGLLESLAPSSEDWVQLAFVDGHYVAEYSANGHAGNGVVVGRLGDSADLSSNGAGEGIGSLADVGCDGFTALNTAFATDGAVVKVSAGSSAPTVHLVYVTTEDDEAIATHPRTLVIAGEGSECTVVESYVGVGESTYFTNSVSEILLEAGAHVDHYRLMMDSPGAFHIGSTPVRLSEDSTFNSLSFARGGRVARNGLHVMLDAPGSSCVVGGLYFTYGTQHIDNHVVIDHLKPHTSSDLYFKGILDDRSRAVFSGGVIVHPNAQKSEAYQKDQNLLLSEGARINTKPMLEIYADDIQATHGATAGAVAEEAIFYMRSRGIDEKTARDLLVHGFAKEIIDRVSLEPLREYLDGLFADGLPGARSSHSKGKKSRG
ncbi:MAG: Fe-S cluster assembly protein SufD [Chloroflexota bacterium]|nr:Fe-S cluster assembly protein SufD [Chloroflexota bacterium]